MVNRLSKLRSAMVKRHLDAVLVSSVPNIIYLTGFSHFSKDEREAFLFIVARPLGSSHETSDIVGYILTDARYSEAVRNKIKNFELVETSSKLTFEKALKTLAKKHKVKRVGFDHHDITVAEHKKLSSCFNDLNLPREISKKFFRGHFSVDKLRTIKSPAEISAIEKACELGDKTFKYIFNRIKSGITEKQLAFEIEFFIKKHGGDISFPPIVAFGKNSAIPHHKTSDQRLKTNDQILLDFGVKLNNYCSDMTRTIFFGSANAEYKKIYQTVLAAQEKAIEALINKDTPSLRSILAKDIDKIARECIVSQGYPTIPHSLGHGIGLEVHESPRLSPKSKDILKEGMVFTIEPGIYIPSFGGVRIEDVVVLEKSGPRLLTNSPKGLVGM